MLPAILKSAVQSTSTAIFIPSSFDFIRIQNYFRKQGLSYTVLSEYVARFSLLSIVGQETNRGIIDTRQTKIYPERDRVSLLASIRSCSSASDSTSSASAYDPTDLHPQGDDGAHRYKIRGIRNLVFYGRPDHPQFYTEFLSFPFLDDEVEPSDVTSRVLYSRFDWFRLERIAGSRGARQMIQNNTS